VDKLAPRLGITRQIDSSAQKYVSKILPAQFYASDAAKRSGLPLYVVDRWDRNGVLRPSIRRATGSGRHRPRLYSIEDVVALSVANRLRRLDVPTRRIARIVKAVRANAKIEPRYLLSDGKSVFFRDDGGELIDLLRERQTAFALFLEPLYPKR